VDAGKGPAAGAELVFVHGAGDSAAIWADQVAHYATAARVCALDLPGHGTRLGERAHDDHTRNADELKTMIREREFAAPVVVGHSMGGAVALRLALEHPEVPSALVLVATGARLRMRPDFLETARRRAETMPPNQPVGATAHVEEAVSPSSSDRARRFVLAHSGQATAQAVYADFLANDGFDVMGDLGRIDKPVLVVGGADDRLTPPKFIAYLGDHIPGARVGLVAEAGHYVFVEQPARFQELLDAFLSDLARRQVTAAGR